MHFSDASTQEYEDLDRAVITDRIYEPVRPDWFVEEVKDHRGDSARPSRKYEAKQKAKAEKDKAFAQLCKRDKDANPVKTR